MIAQAFPHLRAALYGQPWAILPDRLEAIAEVLERRCEGVRLAPDEIAAIKGKRAPNGRLIPYLAMDDGVVAMTAIGGAGASQQAGSVIAVINVAGIIDQHASNVDDISGPGGTSTERVGRSFDAAIADPAVKAVVLNIDSPGGSVFGVQALGDKIRAGRDKKPVVAQVNSMAASAAYWLAAQAGEIVVTPGGQVGSIGVYSMHQDVSGAMEQAGVKFSFVSAGKYKVEGNPYEPLATEARSAVQRVVDSYYADFLGAVAKGRGVKVSDVRNGFGEGRMVRENDAVGLGMADSVATLEQTLDRLAGRKPGGKGAKAEGAFPAIAAEDVAQHLAETREFPASDIGKSGSEPAPAAANEDAPAPAQISADQHAMRARRLAHHLRGA